jgi:NAD(P)-dependent dehydrogenase (short-subunit alcohol dehydrogenase family)
MTNQDRVAVVTGGVRGLGLETAIELARRGHRVVVGGRDEVRGRQVQASLADENCRVVFSTLDVADTRSIERFTEAVLGQFGHVDVLVNNAGIMIDDDQPSQTLTDYAQTIETTFRTNTLGPFLLCQALIPQMLTRGHGRVVNVSSGMGQLADMGSGDPGYRISKTALNAVTRIFAAECRGTNVLVNSVCPGWVRTEMGGPRAPRTIQKGADTIVWLATLPDGSPSGGFFRDRELIDW